MLAALTVRDIVLIEQAALEFAPGLNVLTGETGAGKSILLDSLGLAVGGRGRAGVRPGAAQGSATAVFEPPHRHARPCAAARSRRCRPRARSCCAAPWPPTAAPAPSSMTKRWAWACCKDLGGLLLEVHGQAGRSRPVRHRHPSRLAGRLRRPERLMRETAALFAGIGRGARARWRSCKARGRRARPNADFVRAAAKELVGLRAGRGRRREAGRRTRADDERGAHRRRCLRGAGTSVGRARRGDTLAAALKKLSRLNEEARKAAAAAEARAGTGLHALAEEARRELDSLLSRLDIDAGALGEEGRAAVRACAPWRANMA